MNAHLAIWRQQVQQAPCSPEERHLAPAAVLELREARGDKLVTVLLVSTLQQVRTDTETRESRHKSR